MLSLISVLAEVRKKQLQAREKVLQIRDLIDKTDAYSLALAK